MFLATFFSHLHLLQDCLMLSNHHILFYIFNQRLKKLTYCPFSLNSLQMSAWCQQKSFQLTPFYFKWNQTIKDWKDISKYFLRFVNQRMSMKSNQHYHSLKKKHFNVQLELFIFAVGMIKGCTAVCIIIQWLHNIWIHDWWMLIQFTIERRMYSIIYSNIGSLSIFMS